MGAEFFSPSCMGAFWDHRSRRTVAGARIFDDNAQLDVHSSWLATLSLFFCISLASPSHSTTHLSLLQYFNTPEAPVVQVVAQLSTLESIASTPTHQLTKRELTFIFDSTCSSAVY
ncbi:hypothetical protein PENSPDRAFT_660120 [Peniophora sp. CONT]|nr:hypothetical protein PENSPDRAFT_660120 [Peniophora sp. CONT]